MIGDYEGARRDAEERDMEQWRRMFNIAGSCGKDPRPMPPPPAPHQNWCQYEQDHRQCFNLAMPGRTWCRMHAEYDIWQRQTWGNLSTFEERSRVGHGFAVKWFPSTYQWSLKLYGPEEIAALMDAWTEFHQRACPPIEEAAD